MQWSRGQSWPESQPVDLMEVHLAAKALSPGRRMACRCVISAALGDRGCSDTSLDIALPTQKPSRAPHWRYGEVCLLPQKAFPGLPGGGHTSVCSTASFSGLCQHTIASYLASFRNPLLPASIVLPQICKNTTEEFPSFCIGHEWSTVSLPASQHSIVTKSKALALRSGSSWVCDCAIASGRPVTSFSYSVEERRVPPTLGLLGG